MSNYSQKCQQKKTLRNREKKLVKTKEKGEKKSCCNCCWQSVALLPLEVRVGVVSAETLRVLADVSGLGTGLRRRKHVVELAFGPDRGGEVVVVVGGSVGSRRGRAGTGRRCR